MTTTIITDSQIKAIRTQADQADDVSMRIICDMAIDGEDSLYDEGCLDEDGRPDYSGGGHSSDELRAIRKALRMSTAEARAKCADAIAYAAGEAGVEVRS